MAANFEHTFLYHVYKNRGVNWKKHHINTRTPIDSRRIRIHYWSEDNAWSKNYRERINNVTGKSNLESYLEWFQSREPGTDYVYCSNNRDDVNLPGKKMPAVCHGLNDWQHYTKFMSTASYLISNGDEKFYQHYGLTSSDGRALRSVQMLYQQIMRTNLRDSSSQKIIDIYLPTFTEVRDLMRYFPDAIIQDCKKPKAGTNTGITGILKPNWNGDYHEEPAHDAIPATYIGMGSNTYAKEVSNIPYSDDQDTEEDNICTWDIEEKKFYSHMPDLGNQDQIKNIERVFLAENEGGNKAYYPPQKAPIFKRDTPKRGRPSNGSALLRGIASINNDIFLSGLTKEEIKSAKRSKLRLFVTGQFHNGSSFKRENCFGNINLLAFDFDNTDLTDKQIKQTFLTCELLIYTTPSHDPNADLRRIRVVVICDRAMTLDEHSKLMAYYQSKFQKLSDQHGLDETKLTPWSKFYMPHAESEKTHITKEKKPLNVDAILSKIPRKPFITVPDISDFEFKNSINTSPPLHSRKEKCLELIDQMTPGNRSNYAVTVAGMAKHLNEQDKQELYQLVMYQGVDKAALKQFRKYSGMN